MRFESLTTVVRVAYEKLGYLLTAGYYLFWKRAVE